MEALSAKNELLSSKSEMLNTKLDTQKKRLQELDEQGVDPTSKQYQKLLQDLYNTEAELNKNEAEIKATANEMDNLGKEVDDTAESTEKLGDKGLKAGDILKANLASQAIIAGVKALAGAIKEGVKALGEMVLGAANAADDLNTMAKVTGLSTEELQKFQYASDLIDVSMDTLTGSMTKLTSNMGKAREGTGAAADAFKTLGVAVTNSDGSLRDRNEVFQETIAALGQIGNETERDALAMDIFGKSAQDLNPLILGGAEALQQLGDEAEAAGLIMSQDTLDSLNEVSDAVDKLKGTTNAAKNVLVAAFAGPAADAINALTGYVTRLLSAIQEGDWDEIGNIVSDVFDRVSEMANEFFPKAIEFGTKVILGLVESLVSNLPEIFDTGIKILSTLIESLTSELPKLIPVAISAILTLVDKLTDPDMLAQLVGAALELIVALAGGLIEALPELVKQAPVIVARLLTALIQSAPDIIAAGLELITQLVFGLMDAFGLIDDKAYDAVMEFKDGIINKIHEIRDAGRQLLQGLWDGINDKIAWLKGKVSGIVDTIKSWFTGKDGFDEHSPSKWAAGVFENVLEGGVKGLEAGLPALLAEAGNVTAGVQSAMEQAALGMTPRINAPEYSTRDQVADTVNGISTALSAMPRGVTKVIFQVNGRTFAEETIGDFVDVARANGTPILNPAVG